MVAQLVEDLVHLEGGQDRLDQHGGLDRAAREPELLLGVDEDVVPEPRFEVALHLGQIEVWAGAAVEQLLGVVEEVERRSRRASRRSAAPSTSDVLLGQVPAARPDQQRRGLLVAARTSCPPGSRNR